jgi:hypothetical protein
MNTHEKIECFRRDGVFTVEQIQSEAESLFDQELTEDELSQVIDVIYEHYQYILQESIQKILEDNELK